MRRLMAVVTVLVFAFCLAFFRHVGAPAMYYPCPPKYGHVAHIWFPPWHPPGSYFGSERYLGWTEVYTCAATLTISGQG